MSPYFYFSRFRTSTELKLISPFDVRNHFIMKVLFFIKKLKVFTEYQSFSILVNRDNILATELHEPDLFWWVVNFHTSIRQQSIFKGIFNKVRKKHVFKETVILLYRLLGFRWRNEIFSKSINLSLWKVEGHFFIENFQCRLIIIERNFFDVLFFKLGSNFMRFLFLWQVIALLNGDDVLLDILFVCNKCLLF